MSLQEWGQTFRGPRPDVTNLRTFRELASLALLRSLRGNCVINIYVKIVVFSPPELKTSTEKIHEHDPPDLPKAVRSSGADCFRTPQLSGHKKSSLGRMMKQTGSAAPA